MKYTLLQIVQDVLNDIDGDEVNSISDTTESLQVANLARSTFDAMMTNRNWPHTRQLIQLNPSGSTALPTHLGLPSGVKRVIFVNYNKQSLTDTRNKYLEVRYKEPEAFLRMCNQRVSTASNVVIVTDPTGIVLNLFNNFAPTYYTSFDDQTIIFDSYDSTVDSTIKASKIQAMAYVIPTFTLSDTFIPDLPDEAFPSFIQELKSAASMKLRQTPDPKAEQSAVAQRRWLSRQDWVIAGGIGKPDYGRKPRKYGHERRIQRLYD